MKNKKMIGTWLVATFALMLVSVGITYAFFSYIKIGEENVIKLGDIYFNSDYSNVTLSNVFPINKSKIDSDTENTMTVNVNITGYTTYEQGVDYKIMAEDVNITTNGKNVPISVNVTSENIPNIQTYSFEDEMIVVENSVFAQGNIMPSNGNVDGTVTIKAYIDKANVVITDTYDGSESDEMGTTNDFVNGREVFTTSEWNNLDNNGGISFKIKVIAWEHEETLHDVMLANAVMDNEASEFVSSSTGIDFSLPSSDTNGKGLYKLSSTANDTYPIVYYRGDVDNNNVIFGDFCWKAVRTTETGGVKLIYNGEPEGIYEKVSLTENKYTVASNTAGFTFDANDNSWNATITVDDNYTEFVFSVPQGEGYLLEVISDSLGTGDNAYYYLYKDDDYFDYAYLDQSVEFSLGNLTSEQIKLSIYTYSNTNIKFKLRMKTNSGESLGVGCINYNSSSNLEGSYYSGNAQLTYNGYMHNDLNYINTSGLTASSNAYYGNTFIYNNGVYTLTNPMIGYDSTRHYTCASTDINGTCSTILYFIANNQYIKLNNGESIEDVINNSLYVKNVNRINSNIKTVVDNWYENNMLKYTDELEDTVWCNDRSTPATGNYSFANSAWNVNGGTNERYYFNSYDKVYNNHQPTLNCNNQTDKFSVGNKDASLKYPVALLTVDEVMLAGACQNSSGNYYLKSSLFWTMSPAFFGKQDYVDRFTSSYFFVDADGVIKNNSDTDIAYYEIRPSISLASGSSIEDGDGTAANPYVITGY